MEGDRLDVSYTTYGIDIQAIIEAILGLFMRPENFDSFYSFMMSAWGVYSVLAFLVSGVFIFGIVYSYIRIGQLDELAARQLLEAEKRWQELHGGTAGNTQWAQVQHHSESDNPNDWKLAIIEADIMLEKVLREAGFAGNSIGEMLKSASSTNFATLQDAWDAHLVRNKIAHQGADFVLTQRAAREAIFKYQKVFNEFQIL